MRTQKVKSTHSLGVAPRVVGKRPSRKRTEVVAIAPPAPAADPAPASHTDVRQRAMLVNLQVHQWLAHATDEKITEDIAQQHGITAEMGQYRKNLLSKASLEKLRSAGSRLRSVHNRFTLPWDEWGTRILSRAAYPEYNTAVRAGIAEYDQVFRDELEAPGVSGLTKYEEAIEEARRLLNGAFRAADYPTAAQLRRKFGATISVMPIPAAADFRIDLGAEETEHVRLSIEARADDKVTVAMKGVFGRLQGVVAKLVAALKAEKTEAIRTTLFSSAETVLEALPLLNITGDPALDAFAADIKALISGLDAKGLRDSETLRATVLVKADAILSKMNDFFGDD